MSGRLPFRQAHQQSVSGTTRPWRRNADLRLEQRRVFRASDICGSVALIRVSSTIERRLSFLRDAKRDLRFNRPFGRTSSAASLKHSDASSAMSDGSHPMTAGTNLKWIFSWLAHGHNLGPRGEDGSGWVWARASRSLTAQVQARLSLVVGPRPSDHRWLSRHNHHSAVAVKLQERAMIVPKRHKAKLILIDRSSRWGALGDYRAPSVSFGRARLDCSG